MNPLVLAARESGNVLRVIWRNRTGAFFTILLFLSGAWFPISGLPHWLASLADAFPLAPMLDGMRQALVLGNGPGAIWPDLRILLAWLAVGLLVSLRTFRWERAG
jgi:ABC-2 type transport system permease protein